MKLTPAQVKNLMRRGLRLLVDPDPEPEERQRVYEYFGHQCAYCGITIAKGGGDLDHLVSASRGGMNHISNRVLSCKPCNAVKKRDLDWRIFLEKESPDAEALSQRREQIERWIHICGGVQMLNAGLLHVIEEEEVHTTAAYDVACQNVRMANH